MEKINVKVNDGYKNTIIEKRLKRFLYSFGPAAIAFLLLQGVKIL